MPLRLIRGIINMTLIFVEHGHCVRQERRLLMNKSAQVFMMVTFLLTYVFLGILAFTRLKVDSTTGFIFLFVGGGAPTIVAFLMVHLGDESFRRTFYRNLLRFRVNPLWYVFVLVFPLVLGLSAVIAGGTLFIERETLWLTPLFLLGGILFGGLEEVGWRGFLQEKAKRSNILVFGVLFGLVWSVWHLPMFFVEGLSHYEYAFLPFVLQGIVFSLFITWVYARTASIPLVVLFHAMINTSAGLGLSLDFSHTYETYVYLGVLVFFSLLFIQGTGARKSDRSIA